MINKKSITLLLLSTFLVGCGGEGGGDSVNNGANNSSNNPSPPVQTNPITKIESLDIQKTIEEGKANTVSILNNPVVLAKKAEVLEAWNIISNKNAAKARELSPEDKDNYTTFQQKLLEFKYMLQDQALKAVSPLLDHDKKYDTASWKDMADDIKKGKKIQFRLLSIDDFDHNDVLAKILGTTPALTVPEGKLDVSQNSVVEIYDLYHDKNNIVPTSETISRFVTAKLNGMDDSSFEFIRQQLLDTGQFAEEAVRNANIKSIVSEIAQISLLSISEEKAKFVPSIKRDFFALVESFRSDAKDENLRRFMTTKYVMESMIKTGQFNGLFDYIIGEVDSLIGQAYISLEEYNKLTPQPLAADITPSTIGRLARKGTAGVDATQLQLNGISVGKVEMSLPLSINLKGKLDGAKSTVGTIGAVAYKTGNTVLGVIHAYANKGEGFEGDSHQSETSVAVSQSIGNAFIEGQVGYVGTHGVHNADMTGHRYQLSIGFDTEYVSPFVQVAYRDFGTQTDAAAYVGAELNIDSLKADTYSMDTHLTAKAGVDSKTEFTSRLEWSASLNLNSGISFKTDLTVGTVEGSTFGLTANISR